MATRVVEGKRPYTGGKAITVDENRVISLNLRGEKNLIIWDEGDNEIYVDLQIPDGRTPIDAFPVGVNTGRVSSEEGWDVTGTIISAETTSGDNIKILYGDDGTLWIDNGTGTFKQIYFKGDVDSLISTLQSQIDVLSGLGKFLSLWDCVNGEPMSFPLDTPYEYSTGDYYLVGNVSSATPPINYRPDGSEWDDTPSQVTESATVERGDTYIYDGTVWLLQKNTATGGTGTGDVSGPSSAVDGHLALFDGTTGKLIKDGGAVPEGVPSGGNNGDVLTNVSGTPTWQAPSGGGSTIEYVTQAEYTALLPGAENDGKHYFIYHDTGGWQPGANTLVYLPLEGDVNDYSGNGNDGMWTNNGTTEDLTVAQYLTLSSNKVVAKINGTGSSGSHPTIVVPGFNTAPKTISLWVYKSYSGESGYNDTNAAGWKNVAGQLAGDGQNGWEFRVSGSVDNQSNVWYQCGDWSNGRIFPSGGYSYQGQRLHLVATCNNSITSYYINGVLQGSLGKVIQANNDLWIGTSPFEYGNVTAAFFWGCFSEVILEDIEWTATDITNYYNDTKAKYGIS